ncbi:hypothetical protein NN3_19970 [Nocardia neocaledoniensis NBRC 108232]|uniref:Uncharacterized protein n=1 Tax=Nocardia neocaledoniensis TaxID=236511 RepID=A0A317N1G9_9NOCA|nr:hypothetical protein [Nocardia neocaledoniensis]PWV67790.1 hypothetical protein DFR69_119104 [Nocardia neocaledoniensis]GEM30990.1 hypothetical protein NN3_19970 [Nocardia neocaledoniensis NBRC 108232]
MWRSDGVGAEELRWRWALAGLVLGCIAVAVTAFSAQYPVSITAAVVLTGLAVSHLDEYRPAGARLVSLGFGALVPTAAAAAMHGVGSL